MNLLEFGMIKASEIVDDIMLSMILNKNRFYDVKFNELNSLLKKDSVFNNYLYVCTGAQPLVLFDEESLSVVQINSVDFIDYDLKTFSSFIERNSVSIKNNDFEFVLCMAPNYYIQLILNYIIEFELIKDPKQIRKSIITTYSTLEYINDYKSYLKLFKKYSKFKGNELDELDDNITIYRGATSRSTDIKEAMSWTTDIKIAEFFANRFNQNGSIYSCSVNKQDVLAYINLRNESEIIVDPKTIFDIKYINKKD